MNGQTEEMKTIVTDEIRCYKDPEYCVLSETEPFHETKISNSLMKTVLLSDHIKAAGVTCCAQCWQRNQKAYHCLLPRKQNESK
jgi:hypothetical protein